MSSTAKTQKPKTHVMPFLNGQGSLVFCNGRLRNDEHLLIIEASQLFLTSIDNVDPLIIGLDTALGAIYISLV
jgi:hypothetical protein